MSETGRRYTRTAATPRRCKGCGAVLTRHRWLNGKLEGFGAFMKRQHCGAACRSDVGAPMDLDAAISAAEAADTTVAMTDRERRRAKDWIPGSFNQGRLPGNGRKPKLTPEQHAALKADHDAGMRADELAVKYGISPYTVHNSLRRAETAVKLSDFILPVQP
jgi:hypothetical protein